MDAFNVTRYNRADDTFEMAYLLRVLQSKKTVDKSEITLEVDGWVHVSLVTKIGK